MARGDRVVNLADGFRALDARLDRVEIADAPRVQLPRHITEGGFRIAVMPSANRFRCARLTRLRCPSSGFSPRKDSAGAEGALDNV